MLRSVGRCVRTGKVDAAAILHGESRAGGPSERALLASFGDYAAVDQDVAHDLQRAAILASADSHRASLVDLKQAAAGRKRAAVGCGTDVDCGQSFACVANRERRRPGLYDA